MTTWTMEETEIAREMFKRNAHRREFWDVFGRTKDNCKQRLKRLAEKEMRVSIRSVSVSVPERVWEDRNRRLIAQARDLTGSIFKDPPAGYSALDKQRGRPVGNPIDPRWAWAIKRGSIEA